MNHSEVYICALISTQEEDNAFRQHVSALEGCDIHIELFSDPEQCIEFILSMGDEKCFLILGKGQCHLVDIFSTFPSIFYIYLTEIQYYKDASRVRSIISSPEELLIKIKEDKKKLEKNNLIFSISPGTELKAHGSTTKDVRDDGLAFCYIQIMVLIILHTAKPTSNVYEDMLKECRAAYSGNAKQLAKIDEFEKTYEPRKAIWWYTMDSFLYRQLNAALRKGNMLTIWNFRCIIRDLYRELETLYMKQMNKSDGVSNNWHQIYRGQHMTSKEFNQLKDSEGRLIAINSFLSTTKDRTLAETWAGNGEDRPELESVVFEIIIDESEFRDTSVIFADITKESNFVEEGEVLLAIGTTMLIQSVKPEGNIWKISCRAYPFEDTAYRELKTRFPICDELLEFDENTSRLMIGYFLCNMGELEKAEFITQQLDQFENPLLNHIDTMVKMKIEFKKIASTTEPNKWMKRNEHLSKFKKSCQDMNLLLNSNNNFDKNRFQLLEKITDYMMEQDLQSYADICNLLGPAIYSWCEENRNQDLFVGDDRMRSNDFTRRPMETRDTRIPENELSLLPSFEKIKFWSDQSFTKNDPDRHYTLSRIAWGSAQEMDDDKAIKCLQEALSSPCDDDLRAVTYTQLGLIYVKQKNWRSVLEICESIFNLPKLSEKSFALLWAHDISGMLYERFEDNRNALVHYKRAAQLRCKHHSPDDSVISHDKMQIALIFTKLEHLDAAIKMFEEVIELGHPKDIGIAYERMGLIYRLKGDNDMAYYCFTKSLEIARRDVSTDFDLIVKNNIHLAEIEYIWKNFDQVDAHMSEALAMSSNLQCTERTKNEIEVALDQFRTLTTHGHMTRQGMAICDRKHFS